MKHPDSRLLSAYLDGDLPPSQLREMEKHLSGCPSCSTLYLELKEVQHRARNLSEQYPDRVAAMAAEWEAYRTRVGLEEFTPWEAPAREGISD